MAYGTVYITTEGAILAAKTLEAKTLKFPIFTIGDGNLNDSSIENIKKLTDLITPKKQFNVTKISRDTETQVTVRGLFKNTDIEESFYLRELGLYAIDPDTKEYVLFAYVNFGDKAEYINNSITEKKEFYYEFVIKVDNAENVEITVDSSTIYATEKELKDAVQIITKRIKIDKGTYIDELGYIISFLNPKYIVGNNSLEVFWNGTKLIKATETEDGQYKEIGEDGSLSGAIKIHRTVEDGSYTLPKDVIVEIIVRGVEQE